MSCGKQWPGTLIAEIKEAVQAKLAQHAVGRRDRVQSLHGLLGLYRHRKHAPDTTFADLEEMWNKEVTVFAEENNFGKLQALMNPYSMISPDIRAIKVAEYMVLKEKDGSHESFTAPIPVIADHYFESNDLEKSRELFIKLLDIRIARLGIYHMDTVSVMQRLVDIYHKLGQNEDAVPLEQTIVAALEQYYGPDHLITQSIKASQSTESRKKAEFREDLYRVNRGPGFVSTQVGPYFNLLNAKPGEESCHIEWDDDATTWQLAA